MIALILEKAANFVIQKPWAFLSLSFPFRIFVIRSIYFYSNLSISYYVSKASHFSFSQSVSLKAVSWLPYIRLRHHLQLDNFWIMMFDIVKNPLLLLLSQFKIICFWDVLAALSLANIYLSSHNQAVGFGKMHIKGEARKVSTIPNFVFAYPINWTREKIAPTAEMIMGCTLC